MLIDGRHTITGCVHCGLLVFEDEADAGDEYTFAPRGSGIVRSVDAAARFSVATSLTEKAIPELRLEHRLPVPVALDATRGSRSSNTCDYRIVTTVRLHTGVPRLELSISFEYGVDDHRLRVVFALPNLGDHSYVRAAFTTVCRPTNIASQARWQEQPGTTFAKHGFFGAVTRGRDTGLAVINDGAYEYEVSRDGRLALTLVPSIGWLSRDDIPDRPGARGSAYPDSGGAVARSP